jgi:hypothetical protein
MPAETKKDRGLPFGFVGLRRIRCKSPFAWKARAFVQIDPEQNKIIRGMWPSEHERPVYFVELRDNRYAVCWCELDGNYLLLVPSPKSPVPIRHLRYPQEADIVGRVVGFAHLIAPLHSKTVAPLSPGSGTL